MEQVMSWDLMPRHCLGMDETQTSNWFASALRAAKERTGYTTKQIGRRLGRTPKAVERLLDGDNAPQLDAVVAACREFDEVFDAMLQQCGRVASRSEAEQLLSEFAEKLRECRVR